MKSQWQVWLALAAIVLVGAGLRLWGIDRWPAGLHLDEAVEGLDALAIVNGARPIYLEANNGREPLNAYLIAVAVAVLGQTPAAVRLPSAVAGIAMIVGVFLLGRALFNARVGLVAAWVCAISVWAIVITRLGVRPALLPALLVFGVWLLVRAWRDDKRWLWAAAGVVWGLAVYTYLPVRVMVFVLPVWAGLVVLGTAWGRADWRQAARQAVGRLWAGGAWFGAAMGLVALPLAVYTLTHWDVVMGRTGQVALIDPAVGVVENARRVAYSTYVTLQMFVMPGKGDGNWRHNITRRAVFDLWLAVPFVVGLAQLVVNRRWRGVLWLLGVFVGAGLAATIFAREFPHFLRASAILAVVFIWPAVGIEAMRGWVVAHWGAWGRMVAAVGLGALLVGSGWATTQDYVLARHWEREAVQAWFESPYVEMTVRVNQFLGVGWQGAGLAAVAGPAQVDRQVWVVAGVWPDYPPVRFLAGAWPGEEAGMAEWDMAAGLPSDVTADEVLLIGPADGLAALWVAAESAGYAVVESGVAEAPYDAVVRLSPLYAWVMGVAP